MIDRADSNGDGAVSMDDFYNITFTLTNNNGNAGTFSVFDGNLNTTNLNYNQSNTITLPAQGQSSTMIFTDELISCLITQSIGPLNSCSSDCSISINQLDIICSLFTRWLEANVDYKQHMKVQKLVQQK